MHRSYPRDALRAEILLTAVLGCAIGLGIATVATPVVQLAVASRPSAALSPLTATSNTATAPVSLPPQGAPPGIPARRLAPWRRPPAATLTASGGLQVAWWGASAGLALLAATLLLWRRVVLRRRPPCALASQTGVVATPLEAGRSSIQGTSRRQNEDRMDMGPVGDTQFLGVFDGHGGAAVAQWLQEQLRERLARTFDPARPEKSLTRAFLTADKVILQPTRLLFGIPGERGIGGSQCGATGVVALVYAHEGVRRLAVANVGDARCLLLKADGRVEQLTVDHVPDDEGERRRIESKNPNPKLPLVRFVEKTWRVGGLLALSRAFGDAYMKSTGQFEGVSFNNSDYESGFGVIAEPDVKVVDLQPDDAYVLLSSDGLYANVERGGGGGFENADIGPFVLQRAGSPLAATAEALCREAQQRGSTDDVSVLLARL